MSKVILATLDINSPGAMASCMIAPSSIWSFPADADVVEVATGHVVDPVTFYVIAKDRPAWFVEMEHDLKNNVEARLLQILHQAFDF